MCRNVLCMQPQRPVESLFRDECWMNMTMGGEGDDDKFVLARAEALTRAHNYLKLFSPLLRVVSEQQRQTRDNLFNTDSSLKNLINFVFRRLAKLGLVRSVREFQLSPSWNCCCSRVLGARAVLKSD